METVNILLADRHDYFLDGLQIDIQRFIQIDKIFRANNDVEILKIVAENKVDILIADILMPRLNGIETVIKLRRTNKDLKIVVLTSHYRIREIKPVLKLGINIILDKENVKNELIEAVNAIFDNKTYYSKLIQKTINEILQGKRKSTIKQALPSLTNRELELLPYFLQGMSNREIAEEVILSPSTIDTHRTNIYLKFDVKNAVKLILKALAYGIIE